LESAGWLSRDRQMVLLPSFWGTAVTRPKSSSASGPDSYPFLPIETEHWLAIVRSMQLSPQQARIVELLLRGMCLKQIAEAMSIGQPTVRTYLDRVFDRTGTHGRMEMALHVLGISHQIDRGKGVSKTDDT
jgi:DNA-binding NarL/FixJ family response regulator